MEKELPFDLEKFEYVMKDRPVGTFHYKNFSKYVYLHSLKYIDTTDNSNDKDTKLSLLENDNYDEITQEYIYILSYNFIIRTKIDNKIVKGCMVEYPYEKEVCYERPKDPSRDLNVIEHLIGSYNFQNYKDYIENRTQDDPSRTY